MWMAAGRWSKANWTLLLCTVHGPVHSCIVVIKLSAVLCASSYDATIKPPPQTLWLSRCCEGTPAVALLCGRTHEVAWLVALRPFLQDTPEGADDKVTLVTPGPGGVAGARTRLPVAAVQCKTGRSGRKL